MLKNFLIVFIICFLNIGMVTAKENCREGFVLVNETCVNRDGQYYKASDDDGVIGLLTADKVCAQGDCKDKTKLNLYYNQFNMFYLNDANCGYKCNSDGTMCEKGICNVDNCKEGYKNLNVIVMKGIKQNSLGTHATGTKRIVVCQNDSKTKYYDVFEPDKVKLTVFQKLKYYLIELPLMIIKTIVAAIFFVIVAVVSGN